MNNFWIKQKKFIISETLKDLISSYPEEEQKCYCYILNKIIILSKNNKNFYVNINWQYFTSFIGPDYRKYINQLIKWQIIDVNERYFHDPNNNANSFSKSYRLINPNIPTIIYSFEKRRLIPMKDKSNITDKITENLQKNIQKLTVRDELVQQEDNIDEVVAHEWACTTYWRIANVTKGKNVDRLYHTIIEMPKFARRNLLLENKQLFEYDIKSCHPVLLLTLFKDENEIKSFKQLLDNDVYMSIAKTFEINYSREKIKTDFLYFLNGGIQNYFYKYFALYYPLALKNINIFGKNIAAHLQNIEASIMCTGIGNYIIENNMSDIFYVSMHDGWLGLEENEKLISQKVRDLFHLITGYNITITKTDLVSGEKVIL